MSNFDLIDSYRHFHPHTNIFSFSHLDPISRLDRIYTSSTLIPNISQTSYQANALSDYNNFPSIIIKIPQISSFKSSHWKLNESILSISCNNFSIKYFITNLLPPLNPIQQPLIWWDKQKKINYHIITVSKIQKKKTQTQQNILKTKLQVAQTQGLHTQIHLINNQKDQIKQHQQMGTQIRSRLPPFSVLMDPLL